MNGKKNNVNKKLRSRFSRFFRENKPEKLLYLYIVFLLLTALLISVPVKSIQDDVVPENMEGYFLSVSGDTYFFVGEGQLVSFTFTTYGGSAEITILLLSTLGQTTRTLKKLDLSNETKWLSVKIPIQGYLSIAVSTNNRSINIHYEVIRKGIPSSTYVYFPPYLIGAIILIIVMKRRKYPGKLFSHKDLDLSETNKIVLSRGNKVSLREQFKLMFRVEFASLNWNGLIVFLMGIELLYLLVGVKYFVFSLIGIINLNREVLNYEAFLLKNEVVSGIINIILTGKLLFFTPIIIIILIFPVILKEDTPFNYSIETYPINPIIKALAKITALYVAILYWLLLDRSASILVFYFNLLSFNVCLFCYIFNNVIALLITFASILLVLLIYFVIYILIENKMLRIFFPLFFVWLDTQNITEPSNPGYNYSLAKIPFLVILKTTLSIDMSTVYLLENLVIWNVIFIFTIIVLLKRGSLLKKANWKIKVFLRKMLFWK